MRSELIFALLLAAGPALRATVPEKGAEIDEPRYDPAAEITILANVTEVREVPRASPLPGVHVSVKFGTQTFDVYLGPTAFLKQFEMRFAKGDEVRVTGAKVKTPNGPTVILAREVRKDQATLSFRRPRGEPNWE